jgi:protein-disulfide isomerase
MSRRTIFIIVLIAAVLIAGAAYFFLTPSTAKTPSATDVTGVSVNDHILGSPTAPLMLIEYCDIHSPYCKNFNGVLEQIIATYGKDGRVAWAYRHLPLLDQYPDAETAAEASECIAAEGGTEAFFKFIDLAGAAPDGSGYGDIVSRLGIDAGAFSACLADHTYLSRVRAEAGNAINAGATGAPYTILLVNGQPALPISGALSYGQMKQIIDAVLSKMAS